MTKAGFGCMSVSSQHVCELILPSKPCVQPDPSFWPSFWKSWDTLEREGCMEAVLFPNPLNIPIIMALDTLNQDQTLTCQFKIRKPSCLLTQCGDGVVMAISWSNQSLGMSNQSENEISFLSVSLCTHKYAHTPMCKVSHVESVRVVLIVHWGTQVAVKCLASGWRNEQTKQPERKTCCISVIIFYSFRAGFTTSSTTVN